MLCGLNVIPTYFFSCFLSFLGLTHNKYFYVKFHFSLNFIEAPKLLSWYGVWSVNGGHEMNLRIIIAYFQLEGMDSYGIEYRTRVSGPKAGTQL